MCFVGGALVFLALHRVPSSKLWGYPLEAKDRRDILVANIMIALMWLGLFWISPSLLFGVYVPAILTSAAVGVFLFYVQHQFEDAYWEEHDGWTFERGSIDGSSCLQLHGVLGWITASIGVHHIHHLAPKIPNYKLADCAAAVPELSTRVTHLALWGALKTLGLKLYDQETDELISFAEHKRRRASASAA
jgi:omega-6 fatty acid desaturase (delta-12 desaturase)